MGQNETYSAEKEAAEEIGGTKVRIGEGKK
jgi:hypothetical protein